MRTFWPPEEIAIKSANMKILEIVGRKIVKMHIQNQHVNSIVSLVRVRFQLDAKTDIRMKCVTTGRDLDHVEMVKIAVADILIVSLQITVLTIIIMSLFYGQATTVNMCLKILEYIGNRATVYFKHCTENIEKLKSKETTTSKKSIKK